ncbi:MAG: tetratricopeptide repeat protein [Candidatus Aminicenantes bacterium]|nr:tetratricopeptide repeat protein [Candidatus Aminicenantes bacterium]
MLFRRFLVIFFLSAAIVAAAASGDIADLEKKLTGSSGNARLELLNLLAAACNNQDALKQIRYGKEALALARQSHDRRQEAQALFYMGGGYLDRNESQDAISSYSQAEKLFEELRLTTKQFDCIKNIGSVYENMGDFAKAQEYYEQALTLARDAGFEKGMAVATSYIGIIHVYQSELDKALACFFQALAIQEKLGDPAHIANTKSYIGTVYADLGNHEKALEYYNQSLALAVYRDKKDLANTAITLSNIGLEYGHLKKTQESLATYNDALPLSEKVGDKNNVGRVLDSMAGAYVDLKDYERALRFYMRSLDIWRETGSPYLISSTTTNIGELYIYRREKNRL